jgi:dCMP deaminase
MEKIMSRELEWDLTFLRIAKEMGNMSHCVSRKVGAIAVKDGRILMSGINGSPAGECNCDRIFSERNFDPVKHRSWSDVNEIHAEMNLVSFAAKYGISLEGSTVYCTLEPCTQCIKNLIQVGIKRVVYSEQYDRVKEEERNFIKERLQRVNIKIECITE